MNKLIAITAIACTALLQGCSTTPQYSMEMGGSIEQVVSQQTHNPLANEQNGTDLHGSFDGVTGVNILSTYRTHIDKPQEIKNEIQVNIGN